jgi:hypothetical protein
MPRRISATTAARQFRDVLNQVQYARESFEVERHGRLVAHIGPARQDPPRSVTWGDAVAMLRAGPGTDPAFAADLEETRKTILPRPADPW